MIDVHVHAKIGWTKQDAVESMKSCSFDKAVLSALPIDHWGLDLNEGCSRLITEFPDKFVGLVGIHPPDVDQSLRDIEKYGKRGFIGIKLMPTVGYYPDAEEYRVIFEEVNARKWIVLMHCGWCSAGVKEKDLPQSTRFSDPYHIEPLARIYRDTDFILAHGGGATYFPRAWELTKYLKNVYIDTCGGYGPWVLERGGIWLSILNWDRVLFGTDMVIGNPEIAPLYEGWVLTVGRIMKQIGAEEKIEAVMHDNALRLLQAHDVDV